MEKGYHGTSISPAEDVGEWHGEKREWRDDSFDYHRYFHDTQSPEWREEKPAPKNPRYVSYSEQRHKELHKRPEQRVTWDDIRRRGSFVCCNKAGEILLGSL